MEVSVTTPILSVLLYVITGSSLPGARDLEVRIGADLYHLTPN